MKIAMVFENNIKQLVLTPENPHETMCLAALHRNTTMSIYSGEYYACQGGWIRQRETETPKSTIIVLTENDDA